MNGKTDVTKRYIDWAVENGFQVIDVNIPKIVAVEDVSHLLARLRTLLIMRQPQEGYIKSDDSVARAFQTRELATYIWDNYIE
jgi:histone deacetylase 6